MPEELPEQASQWSEDERRRARELLAGRTVVVNVWLVDTDRILYVGHTSTRHSWPESDFANPFVRQARDDREAMVRRYVEWLDSRPELLARLRAGELTGRALGCWCAPQPCHADVLAERAERAR